MVIQLPHFRAEDVRDEICRIAKSETHNVEFLQHAIERMEQRGITSRQGLKVLQDGEQIGAAYWCTDKERSWRCRLSCATAGDKVTVIAK